ncbi:hypothetical protein C8J56DRAFT_1097082 [Mycena floridula]|nr:hypothetical protein C8J56DRAFT_1097082 [Mycena floridula]
MNSFADIINRTPNLLVSTSTEATVKNLAIAPLLHPPPLHEQLLFSNAKPTAEELSSFTQFIPKGKKRVGDLARLFHSSIAVEQKEIYIAEYDELLASLMDFKLVISAVRRLPESILVQIFLHTLTDATTCSREPFSSSLTTIKAPWNLSQVSRTWRNASMSCPELWSTIRACSDDFAKNLSATKARLLQTQLTRSGDEPLNVLVHSEASIVKPNPLLRALISSSSRWRNLVVWLPLTAFDILQGIQPQSIEKLILECIVPRTLSSSDIEASSITTVFAGTPRLKSLEGWCTILMRCHLPFQQLIHCDIRRHSNSVADSLGFLRPQVDLETLHIHCFLDKTRAMPQFPGLELEYLHTLCLSEWERDGSACILLDNLTLPSLRVLKLAQTNLDLQLLLNLIRRSHCAIEELEIASIQGFTDTSFIQLLEEIPALTSLTIYECPAIVTKHFISTLGTEPNLVPFLRVLDLEERQCDVMRIGLDILELARIRSDLKILIYGFPVVFGQKIRIRTMTFWSNRRPL